MSNVDSGDSCRESDNPKPSKEGGDAAEANGVEDAPPYVGVGVHSEASTSMSRDPGCSYGTGESQGDSSSDSATEDAAKNLDNREGRPEDEISHQDIDEGTGEKETKNGENDNNENRDNQESYPEDVIFKQPESIDDANERETDNKIDKTDEIKSEKEQEAYNKLETIKNSSKNWVCQKKERTPGSSIFRAEHEMFSNIFKHTFLEFINIKAGEAEIVTTSYNGMKGEWWINTESDIDSQQNREKWSVADVTPENGINIEATINNIQKMILSEEDSYALTDGLYDWDNEYDCNAAAKSVTVDNKEKK